MAWIRSITYQRLAFMYDGFETCLAPSTEDAWTQNVSRDPTLRMLGCKTYLESQFVLRKFEKQGAMLSCVKTDEGFLLLSIFQLVEFMRVF